MDAARIITTDRLILSPHSLDDFDEMSAMWADPEVVRFLGAAPHSEEDCWARLLRYAGSWDLLGFGIWAVRTRADGVYVGGVGFLEARRTGIDSFRGLPEIGWTLITSAQGKGYATEAVRASLVWGAAHFASRHDRAVALINPENAASISVAARCGFRHYGVARYKNEPAGLWEHQFPR